MKGAAGATAHPDANKLAVRLTINLEAGLGAMCIQYWQRTRDRDPGVHDARLGDSEL